MGFDRGFDIYPRLEPTEENNERYAHFLSEVMSKYEKEPGPGGDQGYSYGREAEIAVLKPQRRGAILEFEVGEHPEIPYNGYCYYFLRSKVSSARTREAEPVIEAVCEIAKKWFGNRVKPWYELVETGDERQWGFYEWGFLHDERDKLNKEIGRGYE